ncbi:hypothetical protein ACTFIV_006008 [Dictyostelium citrinum]
MLKSTQFALLSMANIQNPRVLQPVQLVLHGNQYLKDLSSNSLKNDFAKRSLESINISLNEPNTNSNKIMNAKDWIYSLHSKGALSLSLSRSSNKKQNTHNNSLLYSTCAPLSTHNTESEFVIVSSEDNGNKIQAWQFGRDENNESFPLLSPSAINSPKQMEEYLVWRKIMLGEIRERIREAVERMRDFTILNFHKMELSEQQKINFLNQLTEAEKFIHMDVMVTTAKDIEYLFNYLSLPREYATNSQSRVALQILNAAFSAYIFDNTTKITDPKLNEDFKKLIIELYDSVLDSVICSTNNFNSEY